jgi:prolyl-tRNA editing enzyme YbaK/EbsC (Cys-tRNA(Pro) deacylase)
VFLLSLDILLMMSDLHPKVQKVLDTYEIAYEIFLCDPELADTAAFCDHYGFKLDQSANTILVASKKIEPTKYAACVVLATAKLDVNKKVCQLLDIKRASFANGEETVQLTGMMIGGVVAIGIENMPIYIDEAVMKQPQVIMGGGNRSTKLLLNPKELQKLPDVEIIPELAKTKQE